MWVQLPPSPPKEDIMSRKLSETGLKYIKSVEEMLDLYEPSHNYYYKHMSKVARKFNKDEPYSYGNFQGYRARIEGAIVRAKTTGQLNETIRTAHKSLTTLTAPQRGEKGASYRTVIRELTIARMDEWKDVVFGSNLSPNDAEFADILKNMGLYDNDKFWLAFFRSNYFHPIYQDYRDKIVSPELFKRLSTGEPSYWVERLMDFTAHYEGVKDFRYKGQKMGSDKKIDFIEDDEENEEE